MGCVMEWRLRFSSDADIVRLTNARIIIIRSSVSVHLSVRPIQSRTKGLGNFKFDRNTLLTRVNDTHSKIRVTWI